MNKIYQILISITSFLESNTFQKIFLFLKSFFIFLSFLLLGLIIFFLLKTDILKWYFLEDLIEFLSFKSYIGKKQSKKWKKIKEMISSKRETDFKEAIIEANRMLEEFLKERGIKGRDLLEKMGNISSTLLPPELFEKIKKNFEVYKNIIEDPFLKISRKEAKEIIKNYEKVLKELGFLE